jgi:hypothetical protein
MKIIPFYRINHLYSGIEARDLTIFEIDEKLIHKERAILFILEYEKIRSNYYFFSDNCTTFIRRFLNSSLNVLLAKKILDYPSELANELFNQKIASIYKFIPSKEITLMKDKDKLERTELSNIKKKLENESSHSFMMKSEEEGKFLDDLYQYYSFKWDSVKKLKELANKIYTNNRQYSGQTDVLQEKKTVF